VDGENRRLKSRRGMTDKRRKQIAQEYRRKLDKNILRKNAIAEICANYGVGRSSLYGWCKKYGIPTR